jgi:hypothetical protein
VNCNPAENEQIIIDDVTLSHTNEYIYLGTPISNTPTSRQVLAHIQNKEAQAFKFSSFLRKNSDAPFNVKKAVWNSALMSSILYCCESWLVSDFRTVERLFFRTIKELLGVRQTTCNNLVLVESDIPDVKAIIKNRQVQFFNKMKSRDNFNQSYLNQVIKLAIQLQTPMGRVLDSITRQNETPTYQEQSKLALKQKVREKDSTRTKTYIEISEDLNKNPIYDKNTLIPEYTRIAVTRMRLSSHRLRVETGRWARIPRENRLCPCGESVQTEEHVLLYCHLTEELRNLYPCVKSFTTICDLYSFSDLSLLKPISEFTWKVLKLCERT